RHRLLHTPFPLLSPPAPPPSSFFFLRLPPPPTPPLFPYTTLFRSYRCPPRPVNRACLRGPLCPFGSLCLLARLRGKAGLAGKPRSEEHTSELQSLTNLVCRLLLEKKKHKCCRHLLPPTRRA